MDNLIVNYALNFNLVSILKLKFVPFISNLNDLQNDKQTQKFIERKLNLKVSAYDLRVDLVQTIWKNFMILLLK